jgi:hypothetical protein
MSRIFLCPVAEENDFQPCEKPIIGDRDISHEKSHCPCHQNKLEKESRDNEEKEEEKGEEGKKIHDQQIGIIRSCLKDETWYFSPKELGAGRITVDSKGEERRFPAKSPEPVKKIRVRIAIPPPPPPPPPAV